MFSASMNPRFVYILLSVFNEQQLTLSITKNDFSLPAIQTGKRESDTKHTPAENQKNEKSTVTRSRDHPKL